jgi:hypothetical protein
MSLTRRFASAAAFGLFLAAFAGGSAHAQRAPAAPTAIAAEFRTFIGSFQQALRANDANAVAALTRFPMQHNGDMHDQAAFVRTTYRQLFTQRNRNCLLTARFVYEKDGEGTDSYVVFCGDTGFYFTKKADGFRFAETGVND